MDKFLFIVSFASCFASSWCSKADENLVLLQTSAAKLSWPWDQKDVTIAVGERVLAQWGGNNLWYSGTVQVISSQDSCNILPDDGLTPANTAGWTDLSPTRVRFCAGTCPQMKWCWRVGTPQDCPDTYKLIPSNNFAVEPLKLNDQVVAQWGGNNLWYSGTVMSISGKNSCNILPDDGLTPSNVDGWTDVTVLRVVKIEQYLTWNGPLVEPTSDFPKKWCWRASAYYECGSGLKVDGHGFDFVPPSFFQAAVINVNDRVVAQWGGNNLWYSGSVMEITSPTSCNILPDDGLTPANTAGWTDVSLDRVYKSNDDGSQLKWCWRPTSPNGCPNTYTLEQSTMFNDPTTTTTAPSRTSMPTPSPTPAKAPTTTTTTTVVNVDDLDGTDRDTEVSDQQTGTYECATWCSSKKHENQPWSQKCAWFSCSTCAECP